jgi:hypothetical protein
MAPHAISRSPPKCDHAVISPAFDRRQCVRLFVSLLGVLAVDRTLVLRQDRLPPAELESWLRAFGAGRLGDAAALGRLGAIYLASHPEERDAGQLSRLILGEGGAPVEARLIESIARDWSGHDVTLVEGWVLSRTEARVCAAVHLIGGIPG